MTTPSTTQNGMPTDQLPALAIRRAIILRKRDALRASGFDAEIERASAAAQTFNIAPAEHEKHRREMDDKAANAYAAAAKLDELLTAIDAQIAGEQAAAEPPA